MDSACDSQDTSSSVNQCESNSYSYNTCERDNTYDTNINNNFNTSKENDYTTSLEQPNLQQNDFPSFNNCEDGNNTKDCLSPELQELTSQNDGNEKTLINEENLELNKMNSQDNENDCCTCDNKLSCFAFLSDCFSC